MFTEDARNLFTSLYATITHLLVEKIEVIGNLLSCSQIRCSEWSRIFYDLCTANEKIY